MSVAAQNIFDLTLPRSEVCAGIERLYGWHVSPDPVWSRDARAVLRVDAAHFPEPVTLEVTFDLFHIDPDLPATLEIASDGHAPHAVTLDTSGKHTLIFQTPKMAPGAAFGYVALHGTNLCHSPAQLGLSADDRLLGFQIVALTADGAPLAFPLTFNAEDKPDKALVSGWDIAERGTGVWSVTAAPRIRLPRYMDVSRGKALRFDIGILQRPEGSKPLEVEVRAGTTSLAYWRFEEGHGDVQLCPLDSISNGEDLELTFIFSNLTSPAMLGLSADSRMLGLLLRRIDLVEG